MSKKARDELKSIIELLDEKKATIAKIFLKDFESASDSWERRVYKNRLLNYLCLNIKREKIRDKKFCKKIKAILDEIESSL